MTHLIFDKTFASILKESFTLDPTLQGSIITLYDHYNIGQLPSSLEQWPIARESYKQSLLLVNPFEELNYTEKDITSVQQILSQLNSHTDEILWIWIGANANDISAYYMLLPYFATLLDQIHILHLNNLPFIDDKGAVFTLVYLHELLPKEVVKTKKMIKKISLSEYDIDIEETNKWIHAKDGVRILETGKKIHHHPYAYYDKQLLNFLLDTPIKLGKLVSQATHQCRLTNELFIASRYQYLLSQHANAISIEQGEWGNKWKDIIIKKIKINDGATT